MFSFSFYYENTRRNTSLESVCCIRPCVSGLPALPHLIPTFDCQDGIIPICSQEKVKAREVKSMRTSRGLEVVDLRLPTAYSDERRIVPGSWHTGLLMLHRDHSGFSGISHLTYWVCWTLMPCRMFLWPRFDFLLPFLTSTSFLTKGKQHIIESRNIGYFQNA